MNDSVPYPQVSLYVGDLSREVDEVTLFEKFKQAGEVKSVRICRDMLTRQSLGYAYVNFCRPDDAEKALETMNFDMLQGSSIRIMRSQRDPSLRNSGVGNIFIKNLDKGIDNKAMYDTFSAFGRILSCKIATEENGTSKGYGFVHFETEEAAKCAIEKVNCMLLNGKKVFVGRFMPRIERDKKLSEPGKFTNIYIKNFGSSIDEDGLHKMFSKFGKINSLQVMKTDDGKSKGFGFVDFEDPSAAETAVREVNGTKIEGKSLYVGRAQKKRERRMLLKRKFELIKLEQTNRYNGVNLYIKNLYDAIDDEDLQSAFSRFGTITSAKVMKEGGRSKGFGFVCFSSSEEAAQALSTMNGTILSGKPLYVALAQRKEDRKIHLAAQHLQRLSNMQPTVPSYGYQQNGVPYYIPHLAQSQRYYASQIAQVRPRWPQTVSQTHNGNQIVDAAYIPASTHQGAMTYMTSSLAQNSQRVFRQPAATARLVNTSSLIQVARPVVQVPTSVISNIAASTLNRPSDAYRLSDMRNSPSSSEVNTFASQPSPTQQNTTIQGESFTASMLTNATPQQQKQMLGEEIAKRLVETYPDLANKITGMLLEMDNTYLLRLLEDSKTLKERAEECLAVLRAHQAKEAMTSKKD